MLRKMLIGLDGSRGSFKALEAAILLASLAGTEIHTVSVEEVPRFPGNSGEAVEENETADTRFGTVIAQAQKMAEERGVKLKSHVLVGHEVKVIIDFVARNDYDLLIVGFMGHSAIYDRVMGGTCQNLVRLAPCSVLVVKERDRFLSRETEDEGKP